MECVIETKANTILQFIDGLRGDVHVTFEEGTWAESSKPKLNEQYFVDKAIKKAAFVLERIDKAFPG